MSGEAVIIGVRSLSGGRTPVAVFSGAPDAELAHAVALGAEHAFAKPLGQGAGHRVVERPDGADLAALAAGEIFDAVIVDKELPRGDRLDLLSFLRTHRPAVPVVIVTAFGGPDIRGGRSTRSVQLP